MQAWQVVDRVATPAGELVLRRRGAADFLIQIDGRVLMTSRAHRSEQALAAHACGPIAARRAPRLLLGGLGMGYTLRAALDALPPRARVVVVELEPAVVSWCRGPLAPLCAAPLDDRRVSVRTDDVAAVIAHAAGPGRLFDAIALDLFEGPRGTAAEDREHPLWGRAALARARAALGPGGVLAVWSEHPAPAFEKRLARSGFRVERLREGRGGRVHTIYRGTTPDV